MEYYQIQYIVSLNAYVDLTLEFLTDIPLLHNLLLLGFLLMKQETYFM